jgi:hypothetical protein
MRLEATGVPRNWKEMPIHPLAEKTEFGAGIDLDGLAKHMKKFGYDPNEPIVIFERQLFDGRHRREGAIRAGVTPTFKSFSGDPFAYIAKKAHRQHLNTSQKSLLAAMLSDLYRDQDADNNGQDEGDGLQNRNGEENGQDSSSNNEKAGKVLGIGGRLVALAKLVVKHGTAELQEAVRDRVAKVSDAAKVCKETTDYQNAAIKAVAAGEYKTLVAAVDGIKASEERQPGDDSDSEAEAAKQPEDKAGHYLTPACEAAFASLEKFQAIDSLLKKVQKQIDELSELKGGEQLCRFLKPTGGEGKTINKSEHLNSLIRDLKGTRPYSVCPYCKGTPGNGCKGCNRTGWVTKTTWDGAEEELKAELAK